MPSERRPFAISQANPIDEQAFGWVARLDGGPLTEAEDRALDDWLARDTRHAGAFARALAAAEHLGRAAGLGPDFPARLEQPQLQQRDPPMTRRRVLAGGGGLLAASLVGGVTYQTYRTSGVVRTAKGEVRRIALAEGSAVTLNTSSEIRPDLGARLRQIDLLRGEALFDAAKDPNRPFVVRAGDIRVRAVGTSFTVRRHSSGHVAVAVSEGIVEVSHDQGPIIDRLVAGGIARFDADGAVLANRLDPQLRDQVPAWTNGRIDLEGMTLAQAAGEFERYSDVRIEIDDPAIAARKVAGVYATNDPRGFAEGVALSLGLETAPTADGIVIRRPA